MLKQLSMFDQGAGPTLPPQEKSVKHRSQRDQRQTGEPKRRDVTPLITSESIYRAIFNLQPGEKIPEQVYIQDYANGQIPAWQVQEREEYETLIVLTLIDPTTAKTSLIDGVTHVAQDVFFMPERTLSGPLYLYYHGCEHARNMLGDIRQDARVIAERAAGVKQGSFITRNGNPCRT